MRTLPACLLLLGCLLGGEGGAWAAGSESRLALVVGNGRYRDSPLVNPVNDARELGQALRAVGFEVIELHDQGSAAMRRAIREFGERLRGKDAGLFYFAGHGVQVRGRNFLVPVDADIKYEDEIEDQSVDIGLVLGKMESAKARVNLVILDACRNNPFARSARSAQNGLAPMEAPIGTLIAFATSPGQVASDGTGDNGLYTSHLVRELGQPGLKVEDVFKHVRAAVRVASQGRQIPWENTSLEGDFYFRAARVVDTAALERERRRREEQAIQEAVAQAITRSREEAEREKDRLERHYAERLESERAMLRKEAADRIAALEKAALAAAKPAGAQVRPEALAPAQVATAAAPPAEPGAESAKAEPAKAQAVPGPTQPEPSVEGSAARPAGPPTQLAAVLDSQLARLQPDAESPLAEITPRNAPTSVPEEVARGLKPPPHKVGDFWTYYRTIRDGEAVERRNYATLIVARVEPAGFTVEQSGLDVPWRYDAEGNRLSAMLGPGRNVVYDPVDPVFRFPLVPGASWSAQGREHWPDGVVEVDATVTVAGWEEITTPAGRFRAMKVSQVASRNSEPFPGRTERAKRVSNFWYVPELRNVARYQAFEVTDRGTVTYDQEWELDSFELR